MDKAAALLADVNKKSQPNSSMCWHELGQTPSSYEAFKCIFLWLNTR